MTKLIEMSQVSKNGYLEEEYFNLNVRSGITRTPGGTRMVALPAAFFEGLHAALEDETGQAAGVILYSCGKWWGTQFARRHALEVRQLYRAELKDLPLGVYLQVLERVWALYGWGTIDVDFGLRDHGFIAVHTDNPMYSEVVGNIGRMSEQLLAGVIAAVVSDISGRKLECVQISCRSRGEKRCTFICGIDTRIATIQKLVDGGQSERQITEQIRSGALGLD